MIAASSMEFIFQSTIYILLVNFPIQRYHARVTLQVYNMLIYPGSKPGKKNKIWKIEDDTPHHVQQLILMTNFQVKIISLLHQHEWLLCTEAV